jgi:hypothetical protein
MGCTILEWDETAIWERCYDPNRGEHNGKRPTGDPYELRADKAYKALPRAERRAIRQERLREAGLLLDQQDTRAKYSCHTGKVTLYFGGIERGFQPCPHCGATAGMGFIGVSHDDGRSLSFDPILYHYAQAGHPITADDVDAGLLLAIMADA